MHIRSQNNKQQALRPQYQQATYQTNLYRYQVPPNMIQQQNIQYRQFNPLVNGIINQIPQNSYLNAQFVQNGNQQKYRNNPQQNQMMQQEIRPSQNNQQSIFHQNYVIENSFQIKDKSPQQQFQNYSYEQHHQFCHQHYDDDDQIIKNNTQSINNNKVQPGMHIQLEPLYKKSQVLDNQSQSLPCCITIKTDEVLNQIKEPLDLICIVNTLESKFEEYKNIDKYKHFLLSVLEYLTPQDRLCVIRDGKRVTPLKCVTHANKDFFKKAIQSMEQGGNQLLEFATDTAYRQLDQRKYKNEKTVIFFITNGQNPIVKLLIQTFDMFDFPLILHTFAFRKNHDAILLTQMARLKNGKFYYVDRLDQLADLFKDALGKSVSTVATNVQIQLECYSNQAFQFRTKKLYGKQWKTVQKDYIHQIDLQHIFSGGKIDYVFEIHIPEVSQQIAQDTVLQIGKVTVKYKQMFTNKIVQQTQNLELFIVDDIKKLNDNKRNLNVALQLARAQTEEVIERAQTLISDYDYQKAKELLTKQLKNLQQFKQEDVQFLCKDLKLELQNCQNSEEDHIKFKQTHNIKKIGDGIYEISLK